MLESCPGVVIWFSFFFFFFSVNFNFNFDYFSVSVSLSLSLFPQISQEPVCRMPKRHIN